MKRLGKERGKTCSKNAGQKKEAAYERRAYPRGHEDTQEGVPEAQDPLRDRGVRKGERPLHGPRILHAEPEDQGRDDKRGLGEALQPRQNPARALGAWK